MSENVARLDDATIVDLKARRILRDQQEAIELDPVGSGEEQIGVLTNQEREVFCELMALNNELEGMSKELSARSLEMIADAVRKTGKNEPFQAQIDMSKIFPTDEDAEEYFSVETRLEYLRALYNQSIRERYGHRAVYGVRAGFVVVRVAYKHKLANDFRTA